ncbi:Membrane-fusion protein [Candidatus Magnetoovum chiemensis]|nr:Membrane-fusion protein [Candidatus Magnetoovum chiemensis]
MSQESKIFRKVALDRLSSPEQLDSLMRVTTPLGWLALVTFGFIIVFIVLWSYFGSIPSIVQGNGIFIKTAGVFTVVTTATGQISDIRIKPSDVIYAGQVAARIIQPDIINEIQNIEAEIGILKTQHNINKNNAQKNIETEKQYIEKQKSAYRNKIENAQKQLKWLEEKIRNQEILLKDGLITKQELVSTKQDYDNTKAEINQSQSSIQQLDVQLRQTINQNEQNILNLEQQIESKTASLDMYNNKLKINSTVYSPYTGRVLSVMSSIGDMVNAGSTLMTLDLIGSNIKKLEAVIFVQPADGKKIKIGMPAQISPSTARLDEYGYMPGKVISVSEYPATRESMMDLLHNEDLVSAYSQKGPPIQIIVDLVPDPKTASGFAWSSPRGAALKVDDGTIISSSFIVKEDKPISLAIPLFKKYVLGQY